MDRPRAQHVTFSSQALRDAAFADPRAIVSALHDPAGARKLLSQLWELVASHCRDAGEPAEISPDGIIVYTVGISSYPTVVIALPRPEAPGEAWFVAMVLRLRMLDDGPLLLTPPLFYITLEREFTDDTTALVEWTSDQERHTYGAGPPPSVEAFVHAVEELVQQLLGINDEGSREG